ncbi:unnamed protein product [Rhizophagus irregularis]|nr:unnamed protein product [Rhizophagus irregularis]
MIYPFSTICQQLAMLYFQPEFEKLHRHWVNRPHSDNIITDIYDGQVWKTFKETSGDNSPNFFSSEIADSNIGPHEVSLHKINHYLSPIVDDLTSLWDKLTLKTFEAQEGKKIRVALVLVSCDVSAAKKICGYVSALDCCKKWANYENR